MIPQRIVRHLQGQYFVYCAHAWQQATAMITRRIPITSPPVTAETFDPTWMEGKRLLIFKLHGYPDNPNWYGLDQAGQKPIALTPDLVRSADLSGAIVVAMVCHGAGMQDAFFAAGARAFFGSTEEVRGRETWPGEVDVFVRQLLNLLVNGPQDLAGTFAKAKELYHNSVKEWTEHDQFTLDTFMLTTPKGRYHA